MVSERDGVLAALFIRSAGYIYLPNDEYLFILFIYYVYYFIVFILYYYYTYYIYIILFLFYYYYIYLPNEHCLFVPQAKLSFALAYEEMT